MRRDFDIRKRNWKKKKKTSRHTLIWFESRVTIGGNDEVSLIEKGILFSLFITKTKIEQQIVEGETTRKRTKDCLRRGSMGTRYLSDTNECLIERLKRVWNQFLEVQRRKNINFVDTSSGGLNDSNRGTSRRRRITYTHPCALQQ